MKNKSLITLALVFGVIFIILAIVYWTIPAGSLPSFMPGYELSSTHVHFKHGLAALILALALFAYAWFKSGEKKLSA